MFDEKAYWLWLQHAFGPGSEKPLSIAKRFNNNIEEFHKVGRSFWGTLDFLSGKELASLSLFTPAQAEAQIEYCEKIGQEIICYTDEDYPEKLRQIHAPPAVLYVKGDIADFDNSIVISIVGSRKVDDYSIKFTEYLAYELSKEGFIVVSGGALGIDTAAHRGAMNGFSTTACVLACSLDYPYLMANQMMRQRIVDTGGCLLTEYPVNTNVQKGTFAVRNRIISGLCNGLLVVKGQKKSGTMLTVAHATRQNKDIFAIPGDVSDPNSEGPNMLIQDGATPVLKVDDILQQYSHLYKKKVLSTKEKLLIPTKSVDKLSEKAKMVYNILGTEPVHSSVICARTGLKISQVLSAMTELELLEYIKTYSGQRCSLK